MKPFPNRGIPAPPTQSRYSSHRQHWTWSDHTCYTAAKHAVKGYTESLMCETFAQIVHDVKPSKVTFTGLSGVCSTPGATDEEKREFVATFDKIKLSADEVAGFIRMPYPFWGCRETICRNKI
jgi:hypothetical protein